MTTHEFGIFFTRTYGNGEAADDGAYGRMRLRARPVRAHRGNAADAELPLRGCQRVSGWAYAAILIVPADGLRLSGELPYHAATFRGWGTWILRLSRSNCMKSLNSLLKLPPMGVKMAVKAQMTAPIPSEGLRCQRPVPTKGSQPIFRPLPTPL
jgi:hypothetical protein